MRNERLKKLNCSGYLGAQTQKDFVLFAPDEVPQKSKKLQELGKALNSGKVYARFAAYLRVGHNAIASQTKNTGI